MSFLGVQNFLYYYYIKVRAKCIFIFFFHYFHLSPLPRRRKRKCPEKDVPKMGEFASGSSTLPDRRFIHRPQRRQNAHKAVGSPFRRTIGNYNWTVSPPARGIMKTNKKCFSCFNFFFSISLNLPKEKCEYTV